MQRYVAESFIRPNEDFNSIALTDVSIPNGCHRSDFSSPNALFDDLPMDRLLKMIDGRIYEWCKRNKITVLLHNYLDEIKQNKLVALQGIK